MGHINNLGQQCEGTLCRLCTRCSACRYQKPGTYTKHEHIFTDEPVVEPAPGAKKRAVRKPRAAGATV